MKFLCCACGEIFIPESLFFVFHRLRKFLNTTDHKNCSHFFRDRPSNMYGARCFKYFITLYLSSSLPNFWTIFLCRRKRRKLKNCIVKVINESDFFISRMSSKVDQGSWHNATGKFSDRTLLPIPSVYVTFCHSPDEESWI